MFVIDFDLKTNEDPRILASEKSKKYGVFSLTQRDHLAMGSTPPDELTNEPEKALHEVMTDSQIEDYLNTVLDLVYDPKLVQNGVAKSQKEDFITDFEFLKSVGRLPKSFEDFDIDELPDFNKNI